MCYDGEKEEEETVVANKVETAEGFLVGGVGSTLPPPKVPITPVFVSDPNAQSIRIPVSMYATEGAQIVDTFALVDSGATGSFIDRDLVQKRMIPMLHLPRPLRAQNIDGTHNSGGVIWHKVSIFVRISDAEERREFLVLNCGKENMILGLPWLRETNPTINWASGKVHIPSLPRSPRHDSPRAVAQCYLIRYIPRP
jgi:hypothetical protein